MTEGSICQLEPIIEKTGQRAPALANPDGHAPRFSRYLDFKGELGGCGLVRFGFDRARHLIPAAPENGHRAAGRLIDRGRCRRCRRFEEPRPLGDQNLFVLHGHQFVCRESGSTGDQGPHND